MAVLPLVSQEVFLAASFLVAQLRVVDLFKLLPHHRRSIINPLRCMSKSLNAVWSRSDIGTVTLIELGGSKYAIDTGSLSKQF